MVRALLLVVGFIALAALQGCVSSPQQTLYHPNELRSPYAATIGDPLWAVAPPMNATGTQLADVEAVGDALVASIQQTHGLSCLPLDRTLAAMNALEIRSVRTPADARALAEALGVDGLVVPTLTAWDPYDPPKIGITLALHGRTEAVQAFDRRATLDPRALTQAVSDVGFTDPPSVSDRPTAVTSLHLDARNHATLAAVRSYAVGRHDDANAAGWQTYVIAMPRYVEFAAHEAVARLLDAERSRVSPVITVTSEEPAASGNES